MAKGNTETRQEATWPRTGARASYKIKLKSEQRQLALSQAGGGGGGGDRDQCFLCTLLPGGPASTSSARNPAALGDYYFRSRGRRGGL